MPLPGVISVAAGWAEFCVAMLIFLGSHVVFALPRLRSAATTCLGKTPYRIVFSLLSLVLLYWLVLAARRAPYIPLWDVAGWEFLVPNIAMPIACMLISFGIATPNPFSLGGRRRGFLREVPGIAGFTRHPLLWALALWATAHLVPNGDLAHVALFGLFALYAVASTIMFDRRRQKEMGLATWNSLAAHTSNFPGAALITRRWQPEWRFTSLARFGAGGLIYAVPLFLHRAVIGVSPWPFD